MTVHSWPVRAIRVIATLYAWLLAISLVLFGVLVLEKVGQALFGDPTSYVFTLGWDHPALAGSARMIESSPLVVGRDSPRLGSVLAELQQFLPVVYPAVITGLVLGALRLARNEGLFCDGLPRRLSWLGWTLVAQPAWALVEALCVAYLRVHVLADTTFGGELSTASSSAITWPAVASGVGVLLLRSIVVEGVGLRRDLDGTV